MSSLQNDSSHQFAAAGLTVRQDDFSVQFSLSEDPRFWARVALPLTRPVVMTDFLVGSQDDTAAAQALGAILRHIGQPVAASIEFARLGLPGEPETSKAISRLSRVVETYAVISRRFLSNRHVGVDRGQACLRIFFWEGLKYDKPH